MSTWINRQIYWRLFLQTNEYCNICTRTHVYFVPKGLYWCKSGKTLKALKIRKNFVDVWTFIFMLDAEKSVVPVGNSVWMNTSLYSFTSYTSIALILFKTIRPYSILIERWFILVHLLYYVNFIMVCFGFMPFNVLFSTIT